MRQLLVRHATENAEQRRKTREEIAYELGIDVCRRTLIKAFEKELYHRRRATQKPFLTEKHKADRVQWAWAHLWYDEEQWARVGWADEMTAQVGLGEVWVTRRAEERFLPECCVPRFKRYSACIVSFYARASCHCGLCDATNPFMVGPCSRFWGYSSGCLTCSLTLGPK